MSTTPSIPTPEELCSITSEAKKRAYDERLERLTPYIIDVARKMHKAAESGEHYVIIDFEDDSYMYTDYRFVTDYFYKLGYSVTSRGNEFSYIIQW